MLKKTLLYMSTKLEKHSGKRKGFDHAKSFPWISAKNPPSLFPLSGNLIIPASRGGESSCRTSQPGRTPSQKLQQSHPVFFDFFTNCYHVGIWLFCLWQIISLSRFVPLLGSRVLSMVRPAGIRCGRICHPNLNSTRNIKS